MDEKKAKQQVIRAGKELVRSGLIARTWGNVSCRADSESFFITASGKDYRTLTEDEVIRVCIADLSYRGDVLPSSEKKIHREVYRMCDNAGFIIHTHQDNASAVAAMAGSGICLDKVYPGIGRTVLCADYGLSGSDRLCANAKEVIACSEGNVVLLKNHGAVCWGSDYEEAFQTARVLEEACATYLKKLDPRILSRNKGAIRSLSENVIWNKSQVLLDFARETAVMRPYLDDFAQLAGLYIKVVPKNQKAAERMVRIGHSVIVKGVGAFLTADSKEDAMALSMITEKNAMAFFAARASGGKPLKRRYCIRMRRKYLHSYAKRMK